MLKDAIKIISATPEKIRRELAEMSPREIKTRPAPGKWLVQEIIAHLDDVEYHGFRARIDAILEADNPVLPRFDQDARVSAMRYSRKDPRHTLASLERQRRANV
ncbi:MAG TPA: DinB family protein [Terriglobia bacterium]|nr:DinB family protein [Terriglobia bacterium]